MLRLITGAEVARSSEKLTTRDVGASQLDRVCWILGHTRASSKNQKKNVDCRGTRVVNRVPEDKVRTNTHTSARIEISKEEMQI